MANWAIFRTSGTENNTELSHMQTALSLYRLIQFNCWFNCHRGFPWSHVDDIRCCAAHCTDVLLYARLWWVDRVTRRLVALLLYFIHNRNQRIRLPMTAIIIGWCDWHDRRACIPRTRPSCILHKSTIDMTNVYTTVVYVMDTTAARWRHTPTKLLSLTSPNPNPNHTLTLINPTKL